MDFEMHQVKVYCSDAGFVCLSQWQNDEDGDAVVSLAPEQVDTVVEWLQQVKAEAVAQRAADADEG